MIYIIVLMYYIYIYTYDLSLAVVNAAAERNSSSEIVGKTLHK